MFQLLALINGVILSVMISVNGNLSVKYSAFTAAAIIHAVGSLFALLLCALQKNRKPIWTHRPLWIYLGGAIGVFTTVFQNVAFTHISITSVIALGLLGQTVTSLVIDGFGLLGMERRPLPRYALIGLSLSVFGIFVMLDTTVTTAAFGAALSFASGISMVFSRTANAQLSERAGALQGSLVNHLVGLPITVILAFAAAALSGTATAGVMAAAAAATAGSFQPWIYLGGILGVVVVMLLNITVPRIPGFQLTLLLFVGQVFTGILLDIAAGSYQTGATLWGGIIIAAGIAVNMILERVIPVAVSASKKEPRSS